MRYRNYVYCLTFFFFAAGTTLHAQSAREIVNHYLDTVSKGNIHLWDNVKSMYTESVSSYSQNDFDAQISLTDVNKPTFNKTYKVYPDKTKRELYEDSTCAKKLSAFYFLKNETIIVFENQPPIRKPSLELDEFYSDFLPVQIWKLLDKSKSLKILSVKDFPVDESQCYEIQLITKGRKYLLYINTKTFLLDYWNGRDDEDLTIMTGFKNYRRIDGFLMPMTEFMTRNGIVFFHDDTKKIEINPTIDPDIFEYKD